MMTERHAEPGADVGSFLPRPGEPVAAYAERLRALHRDLTLMLEAIERGIATSRRPEPAEDARPVAPGLPVPPSRPRRFSRLGGEEARFPDESVMEERTVEIRPAADESPREDVRPPVPVRRRGTGARVVVVPSAPEPGERVFERRAQRAPVEPLESAPVAVEPLAVEPAPTSAPAPDAPAPPAPSWPPPAPPRGSRVSAVTVALAVAGWLTALALALVLGFGL
jgi:hypothetical protein